MLIREMNDISQYTALTASCLSALAGNSSIDAQKASPRVSELLNKSFSNKFPYYQEKEEEVDEHQYDKYFKILSAMNERDKKKKEAEEAEKTSKSEGAVDTEPTNMV